MRTMTTIAGLAMVAALVAVPLAAQERPLGQPQHGMMGPCMQMMHGQGGMVHGGMMGMVGGPALMLRLQESLDLTEDQVERLTELHEEARTEMHHHMMQGMQTMQGASELTAGPSPDMAAYESRLREAADHMVRAHTAMAAASVEARQILSAQQRERLDVARQMIQEMHGGMEGGMMPGMMQHSRGAPHHGEGHHGGSHNRPDG